MDAADELGGNEMRRISKAETGKRIRKLLVESGITVREVQEAMELERLLPHGELLRQMEYSIGSAIKKSRQTQMVRCRMQGL